MEQRRQTTGAGQQMVGRRIARRVGGARLILGGASQARRRRLYFLYGRLSFSRLILLFCVYVLYCTHTRRGENVCKGGSGITARASIASIRVVCHKKLNTTFNMSHLFGLNWSVNLSSTSLDMIYKPLCLLFIRQCAAVGGPSTDQIDNISCLVCAASSEKTGSARLCGNNKSSITSHLTRYADV